MHTVDNTIRLGQLVMLSSICDIIYGIYDNVCTVQPLT